MKTLQKRTQVLYRFRCARCSSQFEMTEEEMKTNDPVQHFDCPVCGLGHVRRNDVHKYSVMNDGTEIQNY